MWPVLGLALKVGRIRKCGETLPHRMRPRSRASLFLTSWNILL